MSVLGLDIGNLSSYISVARQGGIEVLTNDYSLHATPTCVAFGSRSRSMGVAARQGVNTNFKSTIMNFKHLIGRNYSDQYAQKFFRFVPCDVVELPGDQIGLKVRYLDKEEVFTPVQVLGAMLTKLKTIVEAQCKDIKKVSDCVVTVPTHFTDVQRRAVECAIKVAGLNGLRIMNESQAIALTYGIYKQDLPEESAPPRRVVFLDVGHASTQASMAAFHKGKLQMLGTKEDMDVGGLWLDDLIREKFRQEFITKYGIDASTNHRAWLRLLDESEKIKKQMSANATNIPLAIECFMNDKDVQGSMNRADFEQLAAPVFERIQRLLLSLLEETGVQAADVDEIEIVGGSSRIPMIRRIITNVFGKEPRTTMNQDEAVSRGAAMQCAILSPSFRVREFHMKDAQPYKIKITWNGGAAEGGESDVFAEREEFPFAKMVTLFRRDTFQVDARYALPNQVPHTISAIGSWRVTGVTPNQDGSARKVKVKVRLNPNGVFSVASATAYETQLVQEEPTAPLTPAPGEPMEQGQNAADSNQQQPQQGEQGGEQAATDEQPKGPKTKTVAIELKVEEHFPLSFDAKKFAEMELQMQQIDEREKRKADAKNSVEEYVYEMREKLSDYYQDYVTEKDADAFRGVLQATEDWLYDEGEDTEQDVYEQRLQELKKYGDPIVERHREAEARGPAFDKFTQLINRTRKAYDDYVAGGEAHSHIDSKDMEKVITAIEEKGGWLMDARQRQERRDKTQTPIVFVQEINEHLVAFENVVNPILNKKKPAPKKDEPPAPPPPNTNAAGGKQSGDAPPTAGHHDQNMEVD